VRAGGAAVRPTPAVLEAEVVTSDSAPAGGRVEFRVVEPAHITDEGRFRLRLETDAGGYAGQVLLCAVGLGGGERVSFTGIVTARPGTSICDVLIDEAGAATVAGGIPPDRLTLFVTRP